MAGGLRQRRPLPGFDANGQVDAAAFAAAVGAGERGRDDGCGQAATAGTPDRMPAVRDITLAGRQMLDGALAQQDSELTETESELQRLSARDRSPEIDAICQRADIEGDKALHRGALRAWYPAAWKLALSERIYEHFRSVNRLKREAQPPAHIMWFLALALLFVVIESITNCKMLEDATEGGITAALAIGAAVSLFNIVVSSLAGFVFGRQCLRVQLGPRLFGYAGTVAFALLMLAAHFLFATFRTLTGSGIEAGVALHSLYAAQNLWAAAQDGLSAVLLVVGGLVSAISFWKGMVLFCDPCVGFLRLWRDRETARAAYAAIEDQALTEQEAITEAAHKQLDAIESEVTEQAQAFALVADVGRRLQARTAVMVAQAVRAIRHAVAVYWNAYAAHCGLAPLPDCACQPVDLDAVIAGPSAVLVHLEAHNTAMVAATRVALNEARRRLNAAAAVRLTAVHSKLIQVQGRAEAMVRHMYPEPLPPVPPADR